jgi:hypothetical protein
MEDGVKPQTTKGAATRYMLVTLDEAGRQFRLYEKQHMAKTPADVTKANTNRDWAEKCEQAAADYRGAING